MTVFAYCAREFEEATRRAAGVTPITCPPTTLETVYLPDLKGHRLLYFDLHGGPGIGFWYGGDGLVALTAGQVRRLDLKGTVVFAANCHLANEGSPMLDALLEAGARYVIGGDGENWGGRRQLFGAPLLGLWFRRLFTWGVPPLRALALAKRRVRMSLFRAKKAGRKKRVEAARDTLAFRAYYRKEKGDEIT